MLFEIGNYILDVDVERTRDFYDQAQLVSDSCNCQGCRNYAAWAATLLEAPKSILERMGIQLQKPPEVYVNCLNEDGSLFYGGFYHLCGRIVHGKETRKQVSENTNVFAEDAFFALADNYMVAFTQDIALLEKDFPTPVIQMEIMANIPFILPEKCCY